MWVPQRGPQLAATEADWCDELFYGGERYGGKSDFQLGYQEDGALRFGQFYRGIVFRKTYNELEELQGRAMEIFPVEGAIYKAHPSAGYPFSNCWYWPSGASVKMRYIEAERDYGRYHGHQYCVGVGTRIRMASGALISIERLRVGDMVATLEGPRRVVATFSPYSAPCVSVRTARGEQLQPLWHPVLTSVESPSESQRDVSQSGAQPLPLSDPWKSAESLLGAAQRTQEISVSRAGDRSGCATSADALRAVLASPASRSDQSRTSTLLHDQDRCDESCAETRRLAESWSGEGLRRPQALAQQGQDRASSAQFCAPDDRAACAWPETTSTPSSPARCAFGRRLGGALLRFASAISRFAARAQVDAASPVRAANLPGEMGCTLGCSRPAPCTYSHPYTKARRPVKIPVESDMVQMDWFGAALVCDLTVEGANHYISECGIVNKNCRISFDEVTEYATPAPLLKMLSTLRSPNGIPCTVRLTGNPGGIGHGWVKAKYVDVAEPMKPYLDPHTGFTRMFVPSRMADNVIGMKADPGYRSRILAATDGNEALRKAWLEGDWDIVAGAFFENWRHKVHVVPKFTPPKHWTRGRSMDWGSAHPFSVGWWCISEGEWVKMANGDERQFPKGALIRYREWYGVERDEAGNPKPDKGLRLDLEAIAKGIKQREAGETINESMSPCGTDLWKVEGGPSFAERMQKIDGGKGPRFKPADTSRVSGWQQVRGRLNGEGGVPMLYVTEDCRDFIRTFPALQNDPHKMEDVDSSGEDHIGDETRYMCMARPWSTVKGPRNTVPAQWTLDWVIQQDEARKAGKI
jgi:hypothetical protein